MSTSYQHPEIKAETACMFHGRSWSHFTSFCYASSELIAQQIDLWWKMDTLCIHYHKFLYQQISCCSTIQYLWSLHTFNNSLTNWRANCPSSSGNTFLELPSCSMASCSIAADEQMQKASTKHSNTPKHSLLSHSFTVHKRVKIGWED